MMTSRIGEEGRGGKGEGDQGERHSTPGDWGMATMTLVASDTGPFRARLSLGSMLTSGWETVQACMSEQVASAPLALDH